MLEHSRLWFEASLAYACKRLIWLQTLCPLRSRVVFVFPEGGCTRAALRWSVKVLLKPHACSGVCEARAVALGMTRSLASGGQTCLQKSHVCHVPSSRHRITCMVRERARRSQDTCPSASLACAVLPDADPERESPRWLPGGVVPVRARASCRPHQPVGVVRGASGQVAGHGLVATWRCNAPRRSPR